MDTVRASDSQIAVTLRQIHEEYRRSRRLAKWTGGCVLGLGALAIITTVVFGSSYVKVDRVVAIYYTELISSLGLSFLTVFLGFNMARALVKRRIGSLCSHFHLDRQAVVGLASDDEIVSASQDFLLLIDKRAATRAIAQAKFKAACQIMSKAQGTVTDAHNSWREAISLLEADQSEQNRERLAVAIIWDSICNLTCAERTRIIRHVYRDPLGGYSEGIPNLTSGCWQASAKEAIDLASRGLQILGEPVESLVSEVIGRARQQEGVSIAEGEKDPRCIIKKEHVRGATVFGDVFVAFLVARIDCGITTNDIIDCARSLRGHEVLTRWL